MAAAVGQQHVQVEGQQCSESLRNGDLLFPGAEAVTAHYSLGNAVGHGAFGVVRICQDERTKELAACKSIDKWSCGFPEGGLGHILEEAAVMRHLQQFQSPTVVALRGVYEDAQSVHFVMDLCRGGDLDQFLRGRGGYRLGEPLAAGIFRQLAEAVRFVHVDAGVLHRDIKPQNVLLERPLASFASSCPVSPGSRCRGETEPKVKLSYEEQTNGASAEEENDGSSDSSLRRVKTYPPGPSSLLQVSTSLREKERDREAFSEGAVAEEPVPRVKLADFGRSMRLKDGETTSGQVTTYSFSAPETIPIMEGEFCTQAARSRRGTYGFPADVWSLGVTLYLMLSGDLPFTGAGRGEEEEDAHCSLFQAILRGCPDLQSGPWTKISAQAKSLVSRMLASDPRKRPTIDRVLEHPWLQLYSADSHSQTFPPSLLRLAERAATARAEPPATAGVKAGDSCAENASKFSKMSHLDRAVSRAATAALLWRPSAMAATSAAAPRSPVGSAEAATPGALEPQVRVSRGVSMWNKVAAQLERENGNCAWRSGGARSYRSLRGMRFELATRWPREGQAVA